MSGGLNHYTRRDRVGVMREVDGKRVIHYMDPRSISIYDDEFFILQQNDIIFTEEMTYNFFRETYNNWSFILSIITSLTGFITMWGIFKSKN